MSRDEADEEEPARIAKVEVFKASRDAIQVNVNGDKRWVPKSAIHDDSEVWDDTDKARGPGRWC